VKKALLVVFLTFFIVGCTDNSSSDNSTEVQLENFKKEIEALEEYNKNYRTQLEAKEQTITELNSELTDYINEQKKLNNYLDRQGVIVGTLNEISKSTMPENYRQAFIKEIQENGSSFTFTVDYASWERKDDAPNGGEVVNEEKELSEIEIDKDTIIYVVDSAQLSYITTKEFIGSWDENGLYQFFFYDDKVLLITQVLLP
jgi:cell division protein FtsB